MGRSPRPLGVRLGSVAVLAAALIAVAAPVAAAKPAPPPSTTATTKPAESKPADDKPADKKVESPPPTTAPATTATTAPAEDPGFSTAKAGDAGSAGPVFGPAPPIGPTEPPPPQPNPRITVIPNTGLQDGQTVQIEATGYTPNTTVGAAQCQRGGVDLNDCDLSRSVITTSDADGNWTASMVVGARMNVGNGVVDCRGADACGIGAARVSDYQEVATSDIAFDPNIEFPPPPVVTVDPARDLVHEQQVTVTGTGFAPGDHLYVQQCVNREGYPVCSYTFAPGDIVADGNGTATASFAVQRLIGYPGELVIDCAEDDCYLQVSSQADRFATARADLRFDPDGPLPPRPSVSASPDRDLVHNQQITLTGSGFSPFEDVQVRQCSLGGDPYPVCSYQSGFPVSGPFVPPVDGDGNLSLTVNVRRLVGYPGPGGVVVDCAEEPGCVIRISSYQDLLHSVDVPIAFDPEVPPPPPPTITVAPNRDLTHNEVVTVSGSGFVANDFVRLYECLEGGDGFQRFCSGSYGGSAPLITDADGSFRTSFTVKRVLGNPGEPNVDCTKDGECALYAQSNTDPFSSTEIDLHFDPDAPLPPPPTLTLEPSTDLPWTSPAHVEGSGFAPNTTYNIVQCTNDSTFFNFRCDFGPTLQTDGEGSLAGDFTIRRVIQAGGSQPIDCAPDACFVAVFSYDDAISFSVVPLTFDPDAPRPPRPTLTVTPSDKLSEGSVVHVEGSGFAPNALLALGQCRGEDTLVPDCGPATIRLLNSDGDGRISVDFTVKPGFVTSVGIVGCYVASGECSIRAATAGDPGATTPPALLTFGGPAPLPPGVGGGDSDGGTTPTPVRNQSTSRLASTGTPVRGYLEFAAIFLGLGTLLVLASRRRTLQI